MIKQKYSLYSIVFIFVFILSLSTYFNLWKQNRITLDAPSYYTYLPATFIHGDLHLKFIDSNPGFFKDKIWYYTIENGQRLIKHPMGISVALSPFFFVGHLTAKMIGAEQTGYSMCYQNMLSIGVLFYLFLGLFFLRKLLLQFVSDKVVAITLIAVVLATNLLWYSTFEGLMPHTISFAFWCMSMYVFFQWLKTGNKKYILAFGFSFGMIALIRPLSVLGISYFLVYLIISKKGEWITLLKNNLKPVVLAAGITLLVNMLQLCYWKYATGHWLYDVYRDEHFVFNSPQILPFLFSFRKGVFVYTPILIFAVFGMIKLFRTNRALFYSTLITLSISIYILSSWWAWSYGICWGMRPMIDYYSLLAIPMALSFESIVNGSTFKRFLLLSTATCLLFFSLFQTWQYKNGLIHYDDMTKEAYFKGLFQTKTSVEWQDLLKPYDWEARMAGKPQPEFSREYFVNRFKEHSVSLRCFNMQYVGVNTKAQNAMAAFAKGIGENSVYTVRLNQDGTINLLCMNRGFVRVSPENRNVLFAIGQSSAEAENFEMIFLEEGDNRIALRSTTNGKYVSVSAMFPNLLFASSTEITAKETFRLSLELPYGLIHSNE